MKRHVLMYGLIGGILIALLRWTEYQFLVVEHSIEIYGGLIAATFALLGIWLGLKLTAKRQTIVVREVPVPAEGPFIPDERKREGLHITRRELEILELIAQGLSNREIAEKGLVEIPRRLLRVVLSIRQGTKKSSAFSAPSDAGGPSL